VADLHPEDMFRNAGLDGSGEASSAGADAGEQGRVEADLAQPVHDHVGQDRQVAGRRGAVGDEPPSIARRPWEHRRAERAALLGVLPLDTAGMHRKAGVALESEQLSDDVVLRVARKPEAGLVTG
jgi:hypothetical protein